MTMCSYILIQEKITKHTWEENGVPDKNVKITANTGAL
jgi:hypothetical protein